MLDRYKRIVLPVLAAVIIVAALVYRLASCSPRQNDGIAASSAVSEPGASAAPVSPPPVSSGTAFSVTDEDIRKVFSKYDFEVRTILDAGEAAAVEFYYAKCSGQVPSRFAWVDRASGAYDIVSDGLLADKFTVMPDGRLMVLTTGIDFTTNIQWFPEVFISTYTADEDNPFAVRFDTDTRPYYMPVNMAFSVGDDRSAVLDNLSFAFDTVSAGFETRPPADSTESAESDVRCIPKTSVACSSGLCYITFYNTVLSPNFKSPQAGTGDALRSFVSIESDGVNTLLILKLGENAQRYHLASTVSPGDGMPYAVLSFRADSSVDYPPGW